MNKLTFHNILLVPDLQYLTFLQESNKIAENINFDWYTIYYNLAIEHDGCIVLLKVDNEPVSVCFLTLNSHDMYISHFGTCPEKERRGYGKFMLNEIKKYAIVNGFETIKLNCNEKVKDFYEKGGFIMDSKKYLTSSSESNYIYYWDNTMIDNIKLNNDLDKSNYSIIFKKNRIDPIITMKLNCIDDLPDVDYIKNKSYQNYVNYYHNFDTGVFITIRDHNFPVAGCLLQSTYYANKEINTKTLVMVKMSTVNTELKTQYEIFLISSIKNTI